MQFYQTALGSCYGLKLPKRGLEFKKNNLFVSFIIIFGTLSFPILTAIHRGVCRYIAVCGGAADCGRAAPAQSQPEQGTENGLF